MMFRTRLFRAATLASSMNLSTPLSILIYPPNSECPYSLVISSRDRQKLNHESERKKPFYHLTITGFFNKDNRSLHLENQKIYEVTSFLDVMSRLFIFALMFVFLTIFGESVNLILQLRGRKITKWVGPYAFTFHMAITGGLWVITFIVILLLQMEDHPTFHDHLILQYTGLILLVSGGAVALWTCNVLGLKRALCLNFFEEGVPAATEGPYRYLSNPLDYGFWTALIGFALLTGSLYNLVIAVEFILVMIPHVMLENTIL